MPFAYSWHAILNCLTLPISYHLRYATLAYGHYTKDDRYSSLIPTVLKPTANVPAKRTAFLLTPHPVAAWAGRYWGGGYVGLENGLSGQQAENFMDGLFYLGISTVAVILRGDVQWRRPAQPA